MDEKDDGEGVDYHDDEEKDNACEKDDIDGKDEDEDVRIHPPILTLIFSKFIDECVGFESAQIVKMLASGSHDSFASILD